MDLRHLRYFAAVAKAGSLTAAARQVNISQPALSYQLKHLEAELGVQLLLRAPRGVSVTEAGAVLLSRTVALLADFAAIEQALAPFRLAKASPVIIGMSPTAARALAADLMDLCRASGSYSVSVQEGFSDDLLQMVDAGELDCALCYDVPGPDRGKTVIPLVSEALFAVGRPGTFDSSKQSTISFDEVARLPLVLDSTHQAGRRLIDGVAKRRGCHLDIVSATSVTVKRELISRKGLCTIVPFGLHAEEINAGILDARRIVRPSINRTLSFILAPGREQSLLGLSKIVSGLVQRHITAGRMQWVAPIGRRASTR